MDGLALLCNLFADGPVTLKRLRLARIAHLGELERAEPAQLARVLHASVSQARAFSEEARKLTRRLAEEQPSSVARASAVPRLDMSGPHGARAEALPAPAPAGTGAAPALSASLAEPAATQLCPELFPGLDEALCARLAQHQVRTVRALSEFAGLALARRTGIPYATLLSLSIAARRFLIERAREQALQRAAGRNASQRALRDPEREPTRELLPFLPQPRRAPPEAELAGSDEFTLPQVEPESSGPFG
jgi:hypothetical protein